MSWDVGLLEAWKSASSARSARWQLLRMLPRISFPLTAMTVVSVVFGVVLGIVDLVSAGVMIGSIPSAVTDGMESDAGRRLIAALVVAGGAFVLAEALGPFQNLVVGTLGRRLNAELRHRLMRASFRPIGVAHLERPDVLDKVRDVQGIGEGQFSPGGAVSGLVGALQMRLTSLAGAAILFSFRWWLAVLLILYGALARYRLVADTLRQTGKATERTEGMRRADYLRSMALTPDAAKEIRVFGLGEWLLERFKAQWLSSMTEIWRDRRAKGASSWAWSMPWGGLLALAFFEIGRAGIDGEISLTRVAILVPASMAAGGIWLSFHDLLMAYGASSMPALLELEEALTTAPTTSGGRDAGGLPSREIRFDSVTFRYPGQEAVVLDELSLRIEAGRSLAIVGQNGAGKTTLVKLLAGLYEPEAGRIAVDGVPLDALDARSWQRRIAAIFQDFVHYDLTLRENVCFGALERCGDEEALRAVIERAGAVDLVDELTKGWDTVLSREYGDGAELSGGQWQRIALARALFAVEGGAGVLVLDEPTANLDVRAEAELFDRFLELTKGVTAVLVSHRFSSVRHADRIVVLEDGRIVEDGSHDELMTLGARYAHMFALQAARFTETETASDA